MRFKRRPSKRPLLFAAFAILVTAILWAIVSNGRPEVRAVFPEAEAFAVPAPAPLRVTFSRPMNQDSIAPALETLPPRSGKLTWNENTVTFTPDEAWPRGTTVTVTLTTGARTSAGIRLADPFTWSFRTAPTMLAYLWPAVDNAGAGANLYVLDPITGDVAQLTATEYGVLDFSLTPDGLNFLLSVSNSLGGADIALLDLLSRTTETIIDCGRSLCVNPQFDPAGLSIAYANTTERQVYILGPDGQTTLVGEGFFPTWSPAGVLLAYDPTSTGYFAADPATAATAQYPNDTGEPANWSPQGAYFIAPEITKLAADAFASHLLRYSASGLDVLDLTVDPNADDNAPIFSPDGTLIAFARRSLAVETWTPGRQLWVMAADGGDAAALTSAGVYNHTAFTWHPDNSQIAYVRSNQADLNELPEIWLITLDGSPPVRLVINGFAPAWVP